jgi:hypothetical protein
MSAYLMPIKLHEIPIKSSLISFIIYDMWTPPQTQVFSLESLPHLSLWSTRPRHGQVLESTISTLYSINLILRFFCSQNTPIVVVTPTPMCDFVSAAHSPSALLSNSFFWPIREQRLTLTVLVPI